MERRPKREIRAILLRCCLHCSTYHSFLRYYNPTEENRKTIELLKVGNHDDAMDMVCSDPDDNHDDIDECETSILFGFCALLAGNVELADMYVS